MRPSFFAKVGGLFARENVALAFEGLCSAAIGVMMVTTWLGLVMEATRDLHGEAINWIFLACWLLGAPTVGAVLARSALAGLPLGVAGVLLLLQAWKGGEFQGIFLAVGLLAAGVGLGLSLWAGGAFRRWVNRLESGRGLVDSFNALLILGVALFFGLFIGRGMEGAVVVTEPWRLPEEWPSWGWQLGVWGNSYSASVAYADPAFVRVAVWLPVGTVVFRWWLARKGFQVWWPGVGGAVVLAALGWLFLEPWKDFSQEVVLGAELGWRGLVAARRVACELTGPWRAYLNEVFASPWAWGVIHGAWFGLVVASVAVRFRRGTIESGQAGVLTGLWGRRWVKGVVFLGILPLLVVYGGLKLVSSQGWWTVESGAMEGLQVVEVRKVLKVLERLGLGEERLQWLQRNGEGTRLRVGVGEGCKVVEIGLDGSYQLKEAPGNWCWMKDDGGFVACGEWEEPQKRERTGIPYLDRLRWKWKVVFWEGTKLVLGLGEEFQVDPSGRYFYYHEGWCTTAVGRVERPGEVVKLQRFRAETIFGDGERIYLFGDGHRQVEARVLYAHSGPLVEGERFSITGFRKPGGLCFVQDMDLERGRVLVEQGSDGVFPARWYVYHLASGKLEKLGWGKGYGFFLRGDILAAVKTAKAEGRWQVQAWEQ